MPDFPASKVGQKETTGVINHIEEKIRGKLVLENINLVNIERIKGKVKKRPKNTIIIGASLRGINNGEECEGKTINQLSKAPEKMAPVERIIIAVVE